MTDEPQDIVAKAEALLANVTPGAWAFRPYHEEHGAGELYADNEPILFGSVGAIGYDNPADAAFIADAPELVRELIAEVQRLRAAALPHAIFRPIDE